MIFDSFGDYIFYDGAMGTMLQKYGLKRGERPDVMNITAPGSVESVHRLYIEAGSDIICTNSFGCNQEALKQTGYSPEEVIFAAVSIAKQARNAAPADGSPSAAERQDKQTGAASRVKIALDIGPTGVLIDPLGDLEYDQAVEIFARQAIAGEKAGADFAAVETMSDLTELKAAIVAVVEHTKLPVLATMTFDKSGRTFLGCNPEDFAKTAESHGAAAVGLNCSLAPAEMFDTAERIAKATELPLIVKPNAGLPDPVSGEYSISPEEFARQMELFKKIGVRIVGGCCGTTPEYIRVLRETFTGRSSL